MLYQQSINKCILLWYMYYERLGRVPGYNIGVNGGGVVLCTSSMVLVLCVYDALLSKECLMEVIRKDLAVCQVPGGR